MKTFIKSIIYGLVCILFGLFLLAYTQIGLRIAVTMLSYMMPTLEINGYAGTLLSPLNIKQLKYNDGETYLVIKDLELNWQALTFIKTMDVVFNLRAHDLQFIYQSHNNTTSASSNNDWLQHLKPQSVSIDRAVINYENVSTTLNQIYLQEKNQTYDFAAQFNKGYLNGEFAYRGEKNWQLEINTKQLDLYYENQPLAELSFKMKGSVSENNYQAVLNQLQGNFQNKILSGEIHLNGNNEVLNIETANIDLGTAHLTANGYIGDKSKLTYNLAIPNLNALIPSYTGTISLSGHVISELNTTQ